mgnify:CR=1 FL=1
MESIKYFVLFNNSFLFSLLPYSEPDQDLSPNNDPDWDWGEGGHEFSWWCTESPEAHVGRDAVYVALGDELVEVYSPQKPSPVPQHRPPTPHEEHVELEQSPLEP